MSAQVLERPAVPVDRGGRSLPPADHGGEGGRPNPGIAGDPTRFGLLTFLGTISMLFIGFTSAYILRRASADWQPLAPPGLLWVTTAILLASSATLEAARRRLRAWDLASTRNLVGLTGLLGTLFVLGQLAAWRQLAAHGVFLSSNPHSSFFYVLSGVHLVHIAGGLAWFTAVFSKALRLAWVPGQDGLGLFAMYWHFLGAVWLYLLVLLFVF